MIWAELVALYLERQRQRLAPATLEMDERAIGRAVAFLEGLADTPSALVPDHYEALLLAVPTWRGGRENSRWSYNSVRSAISRVRLFLRWACRRGHLLVDVTCGLVVPKVRRAQRRLLTFDEVDRLLAAPDRTTPTGMRNATFLEVFYGTGVRLRECQRLDLMDLDLAGGQIRIREGKPRKDRLVPMGDQLARVLGEYLAWARPALCRADDQAALFLDKLRGRRIGTACIAQLVRRYAVSAGLGPLSAHDLRHNFATHLLESGAELEAVRQMLGHVQIGTTQFYTQIRPLELQFEHQRTHPSARRRKPKRRTKPMSWDAMKTYQEKLAAEGRLESSKWHNHYWLPRFVDYCRELGLEQLDQVAPQHLDGFHQMLLWSVSKTGRMYAPHTISVALSTVRSFLRWAHGQGYLALDPTRDLVLPKPASLRRNLPTPEEMQRLLDTPDASTPIGLRDRLVLELVYSLELTPAACTRLDLADVSLKAGTLTRRTPAPAQALPMRSRLQAVMQRYLSSARPYLTSQTACPALILGCNGQRLGHPRMGQLVRQRIVEAGLAAETTTRVIRQAYLEHMRAAAEHSSSYSTPVQRVRRGRRRSLPGN